MSVLVMRTNRTIHEIDPDRVLGLAVDVSRRLTAGSPEGLETVVGEILDAMTTAVGVGTCRLLEFTPHGAEPRVHVASRAAATDGEQPEARVPDRWLSERLAGGELVTVAPRDELTPGTGTRPDGANRSSRCSLLGVPASIGGRVVCALVIDGTTQTFGWSPVVVERLRLLLEILGGALLRGRDEMALRANVATIEQLNARLVAENVYLKEELKSYHDFDDIVGESPTLRTALARAAQVAPTTSTVLLLGPTGTGKELFARAVHERSRRHARPLVRVNCAALPPTLIESELFGHEKGAFTGAVSMRQGRFELADRGTIFLDEIGDLPKDVQVKLLRVLQEGEFERVGSSHTRKVDVRVIAATHRDIEAAVADGSFRSDLYYRLSVYPIRLPSLRERVDDIPRLVWFFIHRHQKDLGRNIRRVPESVMNTLKSHSWPGNVRELENVVERAMIASNGDTLELDGHSALGASMATASQVETPGTLDAVQRAHIELVLRQCGWRINGTGNAAERLGIHPNTLRFRMKKLGLWDAEGRRRQVQ